MNRQPGRWWLAGPQRLPELPAESLIAACVAAVTMVAIWAELRYAPHGYPPAAFGYALGLIASAVLLVRRRYPILVCLVILLAELVYNTAGYPGAGVELPFFIGVYSVACYATRAVRSLVACAMLILAALVIPTLPPWPVPWYSFAILGPGLALTWVVVLGAAARQRRLAAETRVRIVAEAADARLRGRMARERLRVARELHDVLAHTISVIQVQSGLALDALSQAQRGASDSVDPVSPTDPADHPTDSGRDAAVERARQALRNVRAAARQAMPELRATLGLLRADPAERPEGTKRADLLPQPRLGQIAGLATQARASGLRVDLQVNEEPTLSPLLELTAYRIVQEALTNVIRHAGASAVSVSVRADHGELLIEVRDDGRGPREEGPGGLGLLGMRERAQLVGGILRTGAGPGGGFAVQAWLPLESS